MYRLFQAHVPIPKKKQFNRILILDLMVSKNKSKEKKSVSSKAPLHKVEGYHES
jgi:hypothetical protein